MLNILFRAAIFWISLFELLAGWRDWRGLSWSGGQQRWLMPLPAAALAGWRASWARKVVSLLLTLPFALVLQVALGSLRNRRLDPMGRLLPGRHDDRDVELLRILMREGYLPALHLVPRLG